MKKLFIFLFAASLFTGAFTFKSNAQEIKLGGGLALEGDRPPLGLQFKGTYGLDMLLENLSGSVEFSLFIPSSTRYYKYNRWGIDVDGNWVFWNTGNFDFYAIGGLNISHYSEKYSGPYIDIIDDIGTKPGLNVGGGINFGFSSSMSAYGEVKYILSNYDVAAINLGILFTL